MLSIPWLLSAVQYWRPSQALDKFNVEKDMAAFIKKEFDKKYSPTWHCIVGRNFGALEAASGTALQINYEAVGMQDLLNTVAMQVHT